MSDQIFYTSYFGNHRKFPPNSIVVSISRFNPKNFKEACFKLVAPSEEIMHEYHNGFDSDLMYKRYKEEILSNLSAEMFVKGIYSELVKHLKATNQSIKRLEGPVFIMLCCYERTGEPCHRVMLSEWLNNNGIRCCEF